jgi:hypothetical protein
MDLSMDTIGLFPGRHRDVLVTVRSGAGRAPSVDEAQFSLSDGAVAGMGRIASRAWVAGDSTTVTEIWASLELVRDGTTTVQVSLRGVTKGLTFNVRPDPPVSTAVAVDAFTVIEYADLAYAPLVLLRETSGSAPVDVLWVEFSVPTQTIQGDVCRGLDAGQAGYLSAIDPYLWNNDYIFVQADGTPLPDGPATARLLIRDALGNYGRVEASTTIQRMVSNPQFPDPDSVFSRGVPC